jgi:hypothetical protein
LARETALVASSKDLSRLEQRGVGGCNFTLFAMWFDMESNKDLR